MVRDYGMLCEVGILRISPGDCNVRRRERLISFHTLGSFERPRPGVFDSSKESDDGTWRIQVTWQGRQHCVVAGIALPTVSNPKSHCGRSPTKTNENRRKRGIWAPPSASRGAIASRNVHRISHFLCPYYPTPPHSQAVLLTDAMPIPDIADNIRLLMRSVEAGGRAPAQPALDAKPPHDAESPELP